MISEAIKSELIMGSLFCYHLAMVEKINPSPNLDDVTKAVEIGQLHAWVLNFLRGSGNNPTLAKRLERDGDYQLGPIEYPLEKLKNIMGPDSSFLFQEDPVVLQTKVDAIIEAMRKGWEPPAIIATNLWNDEFEIADGGHRAYALLKQGINKYPTIFYFRNQASKDKFQALF